MESTKDSILMLILEAPDIIFTEELVLMKILKKMITFSTVSQNPMTKMMMRKKKSFLKEVKDQSKELSVFNNKKKISMLSATNPIP